jgi:hypothetical protein
MKIQDNAVFRGAGDEPFTGCGALNGYGLCVQRTQQRGRVEHKARSADRGGKVVTRPTFDDKTDDARHEPRADAGLGWDHPGIGVQNQNAS